MKRLRSKSQSNPTITFGSPLGPGRYPLGILSVLLGLCLCGDGKSYADPTSRLVIAKIMPDHAALP